MKTALKMAALFGVIAFNAGANDLEQRLQDKFHTQSYSKKGADTCLMCHKKDAQVMELFASPHGDLNNGPLAALQCESCHGPQGKHKGKNEPMITFGDELSIEARNSTCESCHSQQHTFEHDLACSDCHQVHQADAQPVQCQDCHQSQASAAMMRSTHLEALECSDCHNPHQPEPLVANDTCYQCHAEKRGPYLWEHAPVTEDCSSCHNPHGSVNDNLLDSRAPQLCQSCHTEAGHPGDIHNDLDGFTQGQSCMNCHNQIHGSNHPAGQQFEK